MAGLDQNQQGFLLTKMPQWMWPTDPMTGQPTNPSQITDPALRQRALDDFMSYVNEEEAKRAQTVAAGGVPGNDAWLRDLDPDGGIRMAAQQHSQSRQQGAPTPPGAPSPVATPPPGAPPVRKQGKAYRDSLMRPGFVRPQSAADRQAAMAADKAMVANGGVAPPPPPVAPAPAVTPPTPPVGLSVDANPALQPVTTTTPPTQPTAVSSRFRRRVNRIRPGASTQTAPPTPTPPTQKPNDY